MAQAKEQREEVIEAMMGHVGNTLRGKLDPASAKELLIGLLAVGGVIAALSLEPAVLAGALGLSHMLKTRNPKQLKKAKAAVQYLRARGYVHLKVRGSEIIVTMTKKGTLYARRHTLRFLPKTLHMPKTWDGKWRLIMFDIPADQRSVRNAFRTLIKRIGAIELQKSVWVYPFDCSEQINLFGKFFELGSEQLRFVLTPSIGEDSRFRKHFKIL